MGWTDLDEKEYEEAKQEELDEAIAERDEARAKCDKLFAENKELKVKLLAAGIK